MKIHCCLSVSGALRWDKRTAKRNLSWVTKPGGERFASVDEMKLELLRALAGGAECIPLGDCDNFDKARGCLGHKDEAGHG